MRYYLGIAEKIDPEIFSKILKSAERGIYAFYIPVQQKIYHVYRSDGNCLTRAWRRGAGIEDLPDLKKKLKSGKENTILEVRRSDFRKILQRLKNAATEKQTQAIVYILEEKIILILDKDGEREFFDFEIKSELRFLQKFQQRLRKALAAVLIDASADWAAEFKWEKKISATWQTILNILQSAEFICFSGRSFPQMQLLGLIYAFYCRENQRRTGNYLLQLNQTQSNLKDKIRRILIISNHYGTKLPALSLNSSFFDSDLPFDAVKHLEGSFDRRRLIELFDENKLAIFYDLIIYRGHAEFRQGQIVWQTGDGGFSLHSNFCFAYIHLACLAEEANSSFRYQLPATWNILPHGLISDSREPILFLRDFLFDLHQGHSFSKSFFRNWHKIEKSSGFYQLCRG